jgi:pilus assembly protein CpaB
MNRTRLLFIGVLALALGGLLSSVVYRALQARTSPAKSAGVDVVVAANDIQVGAKLEEHDVKLVKLPPEDLPAGIFHLKSSVVGRGVVLPLAKGEFLLPVKLSARDVAGLPALIPPGMRAISVRVNEVVAVAGFVVPGTRVDVLLTGSPAGGNESQTTTVLQNVAVVASGQRLERSPSGEPQTVPVITLLVSPEDAQKLTLASNEGKIQLALRNPLDTSQERPPSVRNGALYSGGATASSAAATKPKVKHVPVVQAPLQPSGIKVEVIRGNERKEVNFDQ